MPCKTKDPTPKSIQAFPMLTGTSYQRNAKGGFAFQQSSRNTGKSGASSYGLAMWSFSSLALLPIFPVGVVICLSSAYLHSSWT